jgi:GNAT superfamily N-acetyltransferase
MPDLDVVRGIQAKPAADCSDRERDAFYELLKKSKEIVQAGLRDRIDNRGHTLSFVRVGTVLAAVGAIKNPDVGYRNGKFQDAKILGQHQPDAYPIELGWFYVDESFRGRGLSQLVIRSLTPVFAAQACYATSYAANYPMHKTLIRAGFVQMGMPFASAQDGRSMWLFLRRAGLQGIASMQAEQNAR